MTHPMDAGLSPLQVRRNQQAHAYIIRQLDNDRRKAANDAVEKFWSQAGVDQRKSERRADDRTE